MLRIMQSSNEKQAKSYYTSGLTKDDYYTEGQERAGNWHGRGAELLGLAGEVEKDDFFSLCENRKPRTGGSLTAMTIDGRRVGYDFVFDVPKSVSIVHALTGDEDIERVFEEAVETTMRDIEAEMKTRVRKGGKDEDRVTGNAVWASFTHYTSRPVEDKVDMHLHRHCFLFNATYDLVEKRWKAAQVGDIKRDAPYFQAVFHARVAKALSKLGYEIERSNGGKSWDIKGVPERTKREFSQRTQLIEAAARVLGITSPEVKAKLGATTRQAKARGVKMSTLLKHWLGRIEPHEWEIISGRKGTPPRKLLTVKQAVDFAIGHCFTRQSVLPIRELIAEALRYGVGTVAVEEVKAELDRRDNVIGRDLDGRYMVTTKEVHAQECEMLRLAANSRGTLRPLAAEPDFSMMTGLSEEQQRAVAHLLTSRDRITSVRGVAGSGKTTLMKVFAKHPKRNGQEVFAFAPGSETAYEMLRGEGFHNATTVAMLLKDKDLQAKMRGNVIWVDEAGQLDAETMIELLRISIKQNAKLVTTGDTRQHGPVQRGDALRILEQEGAVVSAEVTEIRRQQGDYKKAVDWLSELEIDKGFEQLDKMGWIKEVETSERYEQLASNYLEVIDSGKEALVVSPTHAECDRTVGCIREGLKERGIIKGLEQSVWRLRDTFMTDPEKTDQARYEPGMVLVFSQNHRIKKIDGVELGFENSSIRRGEKLVVEDRFGDGLKLRTLDGRTKIVELNKPDRFAVFTQDTFKLACGDQIRLTKNGYTQNRKHKLNNKSWYTVRGFTEAGDIVTSKGWVIDRKFGAVTHAYATTSRSGQGKQGHEVILAQCSDSWGASSSQQFNVCTSRGRVKVTVYTDNKRALLDAVRRSTDRMSATELLRDRDAHLTRKERVIKHAHELQRLVADRVRRFEKQTDRERARDFRGVGIDLERELSRE